MHLSISPAQEDYLESIFIIQKKRKIARVKDIAAFIRVKAPSVIEAVSSLQKKGLVLHERYGHIELTPRGLQKAKKLYKKHQLLKSFFCEILGIEETQAEEDACRIEHYLSSETVKKMLAFMEFIANTPGDATQWLNDFQHSLNEKDYP